MSAGKSTMMVILDPWCNDRGKPSDLGLFVVSTFGPRPLNARPAHVNIGIHNLEKS